MKINDPVTLGDLLWFLVVYSIVVLIIALILR